MKSLILFCALVFPQIILAQSAFPGWLAGTWKQDKKENYEHWDRLNDQNLRGFSYRVLNGQLKISEYLDLTDTPDGIVYCATVLGQNSGKSVEFTMTKSGDTLIFENLKHDFPKKISYIRISDNEIDLLVSDGASKSFGYRMKKNIP